METQTIKKEEGILRISKCGEEWTDRMRNNEVLMRIGEECKLLKAVMADDRDARFHTYRKKAS